MDDPPGERSEGSVSEPGAEGAERLYRDLFEEAPVAYFSVGLDGRISRMNRRAEEILGYRAGDCVGRPVLDLYADTEQGKAKARRLFDAFRLGAGPQGEELEMCTADGRTIWIELSSRPIRDEAGSIVESRSVVVDVTDRKRALAMIEKLASFPRNSPGMVVELDTEGGLAYANPAACDVASLLGLGGAEQLLPPDVGAVVRSCLADATGRTDRRHEIRGRTFVWTFHPVPADRVVHGYGIDVTEQIETEDRLRQARKMEALGEFSAGIAHEFNNLLTTVLANAQLLVEHLPPESPEPTRYLRDLEQAAIGGSELVRRILAFSRRRPLLLAPLDPSSVLEELSATLRRLLSDRIEIRLRKADVLPMVIADRGAMEQVLVNLATMARDAMPDGGVLCIDATEVAVEEQNRVGPALIPPGRYLRISVSDTGIEMDRNPFVGMKQGARGAGLDLAMAYDLISQHGGGIEVASAEPSGTTVRIHLPIPAEAAMPASGGAAEPARSPPGGGETILLVEDEDPVRRATARTLEKLGYRVLTAVDGLDGLDVYRTRRREIDLVVTDMSMPGLSGRQMAEAIRGEGSSDVPVLFVSGYYDEALTRDLGQLPRCLLLEKPWSIPQLAEGVRDALSRRS